MPYKVRDSMSLTISALLDEFGSGAHDDGTQACIYVNPVSGSTIHGYGKKFFPILPTLHFKNGKFLNLDATTGGPLEIIGSAVYGPRGTEEEEPAPPKLLVSQLDMSRLVIFY